NHCLAKQPDRRFQSAQDVRNELEGLRAEVTSGRVKSSPRTMGPEPRRITRSMAIAAASVVVAVLAGTIALKALRRQSEGAPGSESDGGASSTGGQSIAVLPFVNMSGERDNEYFSDGLSEEILNVLAKVPTLRVAARTSSFHFKGMTGDVADIGRQLHVTTTLGGRLRRAGDRVRVTAQLVKAGDGFHVWSDAYDRNIQDVFAIQEEIAGQVVEALKIKLLGGSVPTQVKRPTQNMEAYDAYLLGQQRLATRRSDALKEAARYFQKAINLDPNYAQAHAG